MFRILPKEFPHFQLSLEKTTILIKFQYIINLFEYNQKVLTKSITDTLKDKISEVV